MRHLLALVVAVCQMGHGEQTTRLTRCFLAADLKANPLSSLSPTLLPWLPLLCLSTLECSLLSWRGVCGPTVTLTPVCTGRAAADLLLKMAGPG